MMIIRTNKRNVMKYSLIFAVPALILWLAYYRAYMAGDDFQFAVMHGNTAKVRLYLRFAPELAKYYTVHDYTPLHWAAMDGNIPIAKLLISHGADVNAESDQKVTPLFVAALRGHSAMVTFLLKRRANVNAKCLYISYDRGYDGWGCYRTGTALHAAADYGNKAAVLALINDGADVNTTTAYYKETALFLATVADHTDVVQALLAHGADPYIKHEDGRENGTALSCAKSIAVARLLLRYRKRPSQIELSALLRNSITMGDLETVKLALSKSANTNYGRSWATLLITVALSPMSDANSVKVAQWILDRGVRIKSLDPRSRELVYLSILRGKRSMAKFLFAQGCKYDEMLTAVAIGDIDKASEFVRDDPNCINPVKTNGSREESLTALCIAVKMNDLKMVKFLLDAGAKTSPDSQFFASPLESAVSEGDHRLLELVFKHTKNPNPQNLLRFAVEAGCIDNVKFLLANGAKVNADCGGYGTVLNAAIAFDRPEIVEFLLSIGADVKARKELRPALWCAMTYVDHGDTRIADLLLKYGANVNEVWYEGHFKNCLASNTQPVALRYLLKHGWNPNAFTENGKTALDGASNPETIRLLLENAAAQLRTIQFRKAKTDFLNWVFGL